MKFKDVMGRMYVLWVVVGEMYRIVWLVLNIYFC